MVLIVEDSGEGIAPKDLPYIFEPFYQGMQDDQTKKKGSGLGLAICEYIIKKHNGEMFEYTLPHSTPLSNEQHWVRHI